VFAGLVFTEHQPGVGVVTDGHDCNAVFEASKYRSSCFAREEFLPPAISTAQARTDWSIKWRCE
jgi:hypothetical protein